MKCHEHEMFQVWRFPLHCAEYNISTIWCGLVVKTMWWFIEFGCRNRPTLSFKAGICSLPLMRLKDTTKCQILVSLMTNQRDAVAVEKFAAQARFCQCLQSQEENQEVELGTYIQIRCLTMKPMIIEQSSWFIGNLHPDQRTNHARLRQPQREPTAAMAFGEIGHELVVPNQFRRWNGELTRW